MSNRAHLLQVKKTLKRAPKDLIGPPFPERAAHLWRAFNELHSGRTYSANGPNPLTWEGIKAWNELTDAGLQDWEVRGIKALDAEWLRSVNEDA